MAFVERCGFALPMQIQYVLSNGKNFVGSYDSTNSRFTGLSYMFEMLGLAFMNGVHSSLFTYDGTSRIFISSFDSELNELVFPGKPLSEGKTLLAFFFNLLHLVNSRIQLVYRSSVMVILCRCKWLWSFCWQMFSCQA